jgi:hypothetical protein
MRGSFGDGEGTCWAAGRPAGLPGGAGRRVAEGPAVPPPSARAREVDRRGGASHGHTR